MLKKSLLLSLGLTGFVIPLLATNVNNSILKTQDFNKNINAENKIKNDTKQAPEIINWNAFDITATSTGLSWRISDNDAYILNIYIQVFDNQGHYYYEQGNLENLSDTIRIRNLKANTLTNANIGVEYFDFESGDIKEINQTETFITSDVPFLNFHYDHSTVNDVQSNSFEMTIYSQDNYDGQPYKRLFLFENNGDVLDYNLVDSGWSAPSSQTDFGYYWTIDVINLTPNTTYNIDLMFNTQVLLNVQTVHTLS